MYIKNPHSKSLEQDRYIHFMESKDEYNNLTEEDFIRELCSDYIDQEFVQYYQTKFIETAVDSIYDMFSISVNNDIEKDEEHLRKTIEESLQEVLQSRGVPLRVLPYCLGKSLRQDPEIVTGKLRWLDSVVQPEQRTAEWYAMRRDLLTATAISSLFGTQARRNEIIFEKCQPNPPMQRPLSVYDARHWGVKYEPVTRSIYELLYKTQVKEYGCIRHPTVTCVGASPDGINIDAGSRKYGRLIEIKNVVSREITGDPLDDYWIQMQIQMEVCDLDLCDFVETKISEFVTEELYFAGREDYDYTGVALHFVGLLDPLENHYEYLPVKECFAFRGAKWLEKWTKKKQGEYRHQYRLVKTLYWYLEEFSCVVVERNRAWFQAALPRITDVWGTIMQERGNGGWESRAPSRTRRQDADVKTILLSSY
jgi:hypothetical protein